MFDGIINLLTMTLIVIAATVVAVLTVHAIRFIGYLIAHIAVSIIVRIFTRR